MIPEHSILSLTDDHSLYSYQLIIMKYLTYFLAVAFAIIGVSAMPKDMHASKNDMTQKTDKNMTTSGILNPDIPPGAGESSSGFDVSESPKDDGSRPFVSRVLLI